MKMSSLELTFSIFNFNILNLLNFEFFQLIFIACMFMKSYYYSHVCKRGGGREDAREKEREREHDCDYVCLP